MIFQKELSSEIDGTFSCKTQAESARSLPFLALLSTKASAGNQKQILLAINNKKLHIMIALS